MLESLSISFLITFFISSLLYLIKQPLLIGYLISGFLVSHLFFLNQENLQYFSFFANLGLTFLLFLVGLELNWQNLKVIGKTSILVGLLQEISTIILGLLIAMFLGFDFTSALILSLALSFSSTAVVLKIFSDKREIETLHGRLIIGFMVVQDLLAILIFIFLELFASSFYFNSQEIFKELILGFLFLLLFFLINRVIKKLESFFSTSLEYLFLLGIAYIFGVIYLSEKINLGSEIGALLAGISLSNLSLVKEMISRFRPLRDFFLIVFFIYLGFNFSFKFLDLDFLLKTLIFSVFVIIFNPLITMLIMKIFKFTKKTSFIVGLSSGQISEFSFVLANNANKLNLFSQEFLSLTSFVGIITIFISTYLLYYYEFIYQKIEKFLKFWEEKDEDRKILSEKNEIIIVGCDRIGGILLNKLLEMKKNFLVIDFNPEIVKKLKGKGINVIYGDASEIDLWEEMNFSEIKLVISTVPDFKTNLLLVRYLKNKNSEIKFISVANRNEEREILIKNGADLVVNPYILGGEYLGEKIKSYL